MIKRFLAVVALFASSGFAGTMGPVVMQPTMKEGLYVGAGIGGGMYHDFINVYNTTTLNQVERSFNINSALASVFAGIGRTYLDKYYLAAEANSYFPSHQVISHNRPGVTVSSYRFDDVFLVQNYVNLDLLPGYRIQSELLIYGRAGISFSNIFLTQIPTNVSSGVINYVNDKTSTGGRFGAGLAYQLTDHVGAGVDYYYTYNPTSSSYLSPVNVAFQLTSHMNYVGFSLFYTV